MSGIEQACERGADQHGERGAALDEAVGLRHRPLVLADELGQDHALGCEVRRHEAAEERDQAQEEREAQEIGRVQEGDRDENRRACEVGEQHGVPGAEPLNEGPAGDAEDRHRRELGGEDERHLPGRPRRHQHEPREREVRHPRAEHRDDLGADERSHRGLPAGLTGE